MTRRISRGLAVAAGAACLGYVLGGVRPLKAQSNGEAVPARECCQPLLLPIGARAVSLGDAITARTSPDGLFANPALVAGVFEDQFVVYNANKSTEDSNTFSVIINSQVAGTFGLSYRLIDYGEQEARDINDIPTGAIRILAQVLTATYATRVMAGINAGVSYKLYQFRQDCSGFCGTEGFSATTHGLDFGVQFLPSKLPALALGAAVAHAGFPLQVVNAEQASPMPVRLRIGGAYEIGHHILADSAVEVHVASDIVTSLRDGRTFLNIGAELSLEQTLFVRVGYGGGASVAGGAAAGVAARYDRFDVGVAKSFVSDPLDGSEPIQITFAIRF